MEIACGLPCGMPSCGTCHLASEVPVLRSFDIHCKVAPSLRDAGWEKVTEIGVEDALNMHHNPTSRCHSDQRRS